MAELAIPLLGLAGMYLVSNQKKNNVPKAFSGGAPAPVEGYENMGKPVISMQARLRRWRQSSTTSRRGSEGTTDPAES